MENIKLLRSLIAEQNDLVAQMNTEANMTTFDKLEFEDLYYRYVTLQEKIKSIIHESNITDQSA